MNTLHTLLNHRSIRKYKNTSIPQDVLDTIINAANRGSNTGNMQLYSIIITKDEENKKQVFDFHFKQPMVLQAPVLLTFCADINLFSAWCKQRNAEPGYDNFLWYTNACIDATIAAQNAAIAAEAYDLGICYLGTTTYMADKLIEFYNLPKGVVPITTLVVGYPDDTPPLSDRLPNKAVVHEETYKTFTAKEIDDLFLEKESLESTKKLIEENKTDNLAQIFTDKRYKQADNLHFSQVFLDVLKKQGFLS